MGDHCFEGLKLVANGTHHQIAGACGDSHTTNALSQNNAMKVTPADARQRELLHFTALCLLNCGGVAVHHNTGSEWTRNARNDGDLVLGGW